MFDYLFIEHKGETTWVLALKGMVLVYAVLLRLNVLTINQNLVGIFF